MVHLLFLSVNIPSFLYRCVSLVVHVLISLRPFIVVHLWLTMCYYQFSYFHRCESLVVYVLFPRFVLHRCVSLVVHVLSSNFIPPSLSISGCLCVITTFRSFIIVYLWLSMCNYHFSFLHHCVSLVISTVITTVRAFIMLYLWFAMSYYHFSFLHHCLSLVGYALLSIFVLLSLCISDCLCVIITFRSFTTVYLWLSSMCNYHFSFFHHSAPLFVYVLSPIFVSSVHLRMSMFIITFFLHKSAPLVVYALLPLFVS